MEIKHRTLNELVDFCKTTNFSYFNANDSGYTLSVQVPTRFETSEDVDDAHRGMCKLKVKIFHEGLNRNGSFVSKESADEAMKTIADRPLLAYIHQLDNGEYDFESHNMKIVSDDNGNEELVYEEKQIGSFSSEPAFWEHDDEEDKDFVCAYAYISKEYTKAYDILKRKDGTKNSCELCIEEMSFDVKNGYLSLDKFYLSGSTLLGSKEDGTEVQEGMKGSRADIVEFSTENNAMESTKELMKMMQELKESLDNHIKATEADNNSRKEDFEVENTNEIVEEFDELEEVVEDVTTEDEDIEEVVETEDVTPEEEVADDESYEDVVDDESNVTYSITYGDVTKEFSTSLNDKIYALQELVNETYMDSDYDWYSVEVFEDENYVHMYGWSGAYIQSFKCEDNKYSLIGDRTQIFRKYLTQEEINALDEMKTNFASISEELDKYKSEPDKLNLLNSTDYDGIRNTDEFEHLSSRDTYFEMSVEDIEKEANDILLAHAKNNTLNYASNVEQKNVTKHNLPTPKRATGRYGTIFQK